MSRKKTIFVADDEARQREITGAFLQARGYRIQEAPDAETVLALVAQETPDLVLMDVKMPGMGGIAGLHQLHETAPAIPVILLTAYADVRDAVDAMQHGAVNYLEKPIDLQVLLSLIEDTIGSARTPGAEALPPLPRDFLVTSRAMRKVIVEADLVASTDATVLITGESGTGKEKVAEFIHGRSPRQSRPFVVVNCAAIPENLVESELFGHVKGAFTGADAHRKGRFEAAEGGTLFLDEIGELPPPIQPKLLRVLENGAYQRVGESTNQQADVRVIAATNRDPEQEVEAGRFREDLFWRLNVFHIRLPALRERPEAIAALVSLFLKRTARGNARISPAALRLLEAYPWPGNVRELSNIIERAAILAAGRVILPEHLPENIQHGKASMAAPPPDASFPVTRIEDAERLAIREALRKTGGNRQEAARLLGISRRTLFYRLKQYGGAP